MKKENKILRGIGRFFASTLTPILICMIIGCAFFTSVRSMLTVKSVTNILKTIPYEEIIDTESFESIISDIAEKSGEEIAVTDESIGNIVRDVLDSEAVLEVVELYAEDTARIMTGEFDKANISSEKIKDIFSDNSDDIVEILTDNYPELDEKEVKDTVDTIIDEHLSKFIDVLPETEELNASLEDYDVVKVLGVFFTDTILYIIWGIVGLIALLIFVCRLYHFKGLKWVGFSAVIASAILLAMAFALNSELITEFLDIEFITSIASSFADKISTIAYIVGGVGILFIAGSITLFFVYRSKVKREKERLEQAEADEIKAQAKSAQTQTAFAQTTNVQTEQVKTEQPKTEQVEAVPTEQTQAEAETAPVEQVQAEDVQVEPTPTEAETVQTEQPQANAETVSTEQVQSQE